MLFRLRRASQVWRARPDFARILKTPPLSGSDDGAIVFSQLQHKDVLAYLVAAKSFALSTGYGRFILLDDGSLTAEDRALLRQHLPRMEFRTMSEVHYGNLPVGGTWERLITICDLAEHDFVIQLDADTVTCEPLDEVKACVARGHSFALMAGHTAEMLPAARMEELLGPRWREWGTEQVSSNFLVARDPYGILLPYRRYRNFGGEALTDAAVFVHFFGTFRYDEGTYRRMARELAARLNADEQMLSVPRLAAE